jgi:hypothetical protein
MEKDSKDIQLPGPETIPAPPAGFWVKFLAFIIHSLSLLFHEFLWGILFT